MFGSLYVAVDATLGKLFNHSLPSLLIVCGLTPRRQFPEDANVSIEEELAMVKIYVASLGKMVGNGTAATKG